MRIAFIGDGSLGHVRRWAGFFHDRGHEVLLLSFEDVVGCRFAAVRLPRRLPTKLAGYLASLPLLRRELDAFGPDIVNALYVTGYGLLGSLCGHRPLVVSALGSDLLVDYPSSALHRMQARFALKRADLVTTDADVLTEAAVGAGAAESKVIKVFFGIDETVFRPPDGEDSRTGPEPGRPLKVISTRNLYPVYDIAALVDAAPAVCSRFDASFTICGDGPLRAQLEEKAEAYGLAGRFEFTGRLAPEEISERLREADIYVSTSTSDSTSVSLLEAMACGALPAVSDIPANREWIEDGVNGRLFQAGDPEGLAAAIASLAGSPDRAGKTRLANYELVAGKGRWRSNMERMEEALKALEASSGRI